MRLKNEIKTHLVDKSKTLNLGNLAKKLPTKYNPKVVDNSITIFHNRYDRHWQKILADFVELFLRDIIRDTAYYEIKKKKENK